MIKFLRRKMEEARTRKAIDWYMAACLEGLLANPNITKELKTAEWPKIAHHAAAITMYALKARRWLGPGPVGGWGDANVE